MPNSYFRYVRSTLLAVAAVFAAADGAAQQADGAMPVAVVGVDTVAERLLDDTVPVVGRLIATRSGSVAARVAGALTGLDVEVGDHVESGEPFALLDQATLRIHRDLAAGRLAQADAALLTRKEEVALARQELKRLEKLRPTAATSEALYEDALRREAVARSRVAVAEAVRDTAKAELELTELELGYAQVRAPYSGVITARLTEVGAYVQAGQALVRMVSDTDLEIEAEVPFRRLNGLAVGSEVSVALDDGTTHRARVRAVLPEENLLTRTRVVRFTPTFGDTPQSLASGQTVTVRVPAGPRREVLSVHKDAVIKRGEQDMVFVVDGGVAKRRPVRLGIPVGNRFEVLEGLSAGEQVVVRGNERLRPNDPVQVADPS